MIPTRPHKVQLLGEIDLSNRLTPMANISVELQGEDRRFSFQEELRRSGASAGLNRGCTGAFVLATFPRRVQHSKWAKHVDVCVLRKEVDEKVQKRNRLTGGRKAQLDADSALETIVHCLANVTQFSAPKGNAEETI